MGICRIGYPTNIQYCTVENEDLEKRAEPATTAKKEDLPEEGETVAAWTIS
jgi:hypothetical protein